MGGMLIPAALLAASIIAGVWLSCQPAGIEEPNAAVFAIQFHQSRWTHRQMAAERTSGDRL